MTQENEIEFDDALDDFIESQQGIDERVYSFLTSYNQFLQELESEEEGDSR